MSEKESAENLESYMTLNEAGILVPDYDQTIKIFDDGDIVTGDVVKVDRDEVLVDIGYKSEGAIPARELSIRPDANPFDIVKVGERIEALVLQKEDKDGRLILSKKRADYEKAWGKIEELAATGETLAGRVIEIVKGGLIVDIGLRGFLPASLIDVRRTKDLNQFLGQDLECRIIEMDRNRNNVVLSRRAVLEEEKKHEKNKILEKISKGSVLTGKISSIVDFGAFVDLGGIDGLIHISELCWNHIDHPSEVVGLGDDVKVQVLDVDFDRERISLGLRQTQDDPWKEKATKYDIGQTIPGKVTKIVPFGAFIEIEEGLEGLIHISELAYKHIEMPEEIVKVGDDVEAKIVGVDLERRRVSLSIKQTLEPPEEMKAGDAKADEITVEEITVEETIVEEIVIEEAEVEEIKAEETTAEPTAVEETPVEEIPAEMETEEETITEIVAEEITAETVAEEAAETVEVKVEETAEIAAIEQTLVQQDAQDTIKETAVQAEPGSLEDVLQQMKQEHAKKSSTE